jgi:dTDP-4-amino-4,6-dideoxygalactose transaminase
MYHVGEEEIDAIARVIRSRKLFRYTDGSECARFEKRYAKFIGAKHVQLTSSGTAALTAALGGLGIGPGDEVIVPAHTYMASAVAVLAVGAIPVVVDVDESVTIDPVALDAAVGPRTRAVIPVHMWGLPCDMDAVMRVARRRRLLVVEDACQAVGGGYDGRMLGSIGHAGAFSFNYFKNMTCGEGGAVVTSDDRAAEAARCMVDCCGFYWTGRQDGVHPFAVSGSRASEIEGAMLNVQLDRVVPTIRALRRQKKQILKGTGRTALVPNPRHSPDHECGTHVMYLFPTPAQADAFAARAGGTVAGKTGRHNYTEWDAVLNRRAAHHDAFNPFRFPANRKCRRTYDKAMCARSIDVLNRTVMIRTDPDRTPADVKALVARLRAAAAETVGPAPAPSRPRPARRPAVR